MIDEEFNRVMDQLLDNFSPKTIPMLIIIGLGVMTAAGLIAWFTTMVSTFVWSQS